MRLSEFRMRLRKKPSLALWYLLGTWFGCGYWPFGPGTLATLTVLPLYWWLRVHSIPVQATVVAAIIATCFASADRIATDLDLGDPQIIVIDEVAGGLVGLLLVNSSNLIEQISVLLMFRLLDIVKPWPINLTVGGPAAIEIVYDDLAAGVGAGLLVLLGAEIFLKMS